MNEVFVRNANNPMHTGQGEIEIFLTTLYSTLTITMQSNDDPHYFGASSVL